MGGPATSHRQPERDPSIEQHRRGRSRSHSVTKAAICTAVGEPLEIVEVSLDAPGPGEVMVKLGASGVCHSDLSVLDGSLPIILPAVLGHEGAGIVEEVGEGVTKFAPGDHVVISWISQCGICFFCAHGQPELCEPGAVGMMTGGRHDGSQRFSYGGVPVSQMTGAGTFSERTVVEASALVSIDVAVPLDVASLIGCGVLTGFGAAVNTASIKPGGTVAVIGCGGVGLNVIQGALHAGAGQVIAVDVSNEKLETAKLFGATDFVNATEGNPVNAVRKLTEGRGVDTSFEVIGNPATMAQAISMARRGGEMILVGMPKIDVDLTVNAAMGLVYDEKTIKGSFYGSADVRRDVPMIAALYQSGALKLDELISGRIPLAEINDAFDALRDGAVTRSVVVFA